MRYLTLGTAGAAAVLVAACGSAHPRVATGCRPAAAAALQRVARADVTTTPMPPQEGLSGCTYRVAGARVAVTIDRNPQVPFRFDRAVVETDQNSLWAHQPSKAPRLLNGVGTGADWVPGYGQLLATDGRVLVTTVVSGRAPVARALAVAATRGTLRTRSGR